MKDSRVYFIVCMFFIGLSYLPNKIFPRIMLWILASMMFVGMVMNMCLESKKK